MCLEFLDSSVYLKEIAVPVSMQCIIGEDTAEFAPVVSASETAELAEGVVWRNAVVAAALHIQRR